MHPTAHIQCPPPATEMLVRVTPHEGGRDTPTERVREEAEGLSEKEM